MLCHLSNTEHTILGGFCTSIKSIPHSLNFLDFIRSSEVAVITRRAIRGRILWLTRISYIRRWFWSFRSLNRRRRGRTVYHGGRKVRQIGLVQRFMAVVSQLIRFMVFQRWKSTQLARSKSTASLSECSTWENHGRSDSVTGLFT